MNAIADLAAEITALEESADIPALPRAFGKVLGSGRLRAEPHDFFVSEHTGLQLSGQGEHVYLQLRKTGQNTRWVAKQLANFAAVPYKAVSFAGLKDRHAVTEQWFSLHLPGSTDPDWSRLSLEGVEFLQACRHNRKLRQGQLSYNRFRLRVRDCRIAEPDLLQSRLQRIREHGVPNYFGPQRFGRDLNNLRRVLQQPELRRLGREPRGFVISALRAALFNGYLAARVAAGNWYQPLPGEALLSDRPRGAAEDDTAVFAPLRLPAALLWGKGAGGSGGAVKDLEAAWFGRFPAVCAVLERAGARMSRRVMAARVGELQWRYDQDALVLEFMLGPGVFATALLAEILAVEDCALTLAKEESND